MTPLAIFLGKRLLKIFFVVGIGNQDAVLVAKSIPFIMGQANDGVGRGRRFFLAIFVTQRPGDSTIADFIGVLGIPIAPLALEHALCIGSRNGLNRVC